MQIFSLQNINNEIVHKVRTTGGKAALRFSKMFEGHRCFGKAFCADPPTTGFVTEQLSWLNGNLSVSQTVHIGTEP